MTLSRNLGSLVVTLIGSSSLSWRHVGLICSSLCFLPILGVLWVPNSPRWLITRDREEDALLALNFYRKKGHDHTPELREIKEQIENTTSSSGSIWRQMKMLFHRQTLSTLGVLSLITVLVAFSGIYPLTSYLVSILKNTHSDWDPYISAVIYTSVRILGIVVYLSVVDKLGRKPLLIASFFLCSMSTTAYAIYFHLMEETTTSDIKWLPLTLLLLFSFFSGVGLPAIPVLHGELLPTNCRAAGSSLLTCVLLLGGFTASHTYSMMVQTMGQDGTFWFFSACSALLVLVAILWVPETRGRTLEDISKPKPKSKHPEETVHADAQGQHTSQKDSVSTRLSSVCTVPIYDVKELTKPSIQHPARTL